MNKYKSYKSVNKKKSLFFFESAVRGITSWKWKHGSCSMLKHVEQSLFQESSASTYGNFAQKVLAQFQGGGGGGVMGFFTLFWLRVSDTPPKNSRKSTNQNSMKSEWTGEKINIYIYTYKTVPPKSAQKTNYCHWTPKKINCAGGWDLITFKKPYSYKESRENKRAARWARSSICSSWVSACWRQWLPFHWGLQTGMMDEGICHTQGLVLSVPPC